MSDFGGVFEVLAADEEDIRLSSRKALLLSEDRIDKRLGGWLATAKTAEDFKAVFAYTQDQFEGIIRAACEEVGHNDPEGIAKTLEAHYRNILAKGDDDETTEKEHPWNDEDEDDDDKKTSSVRVARRPRMCPYHSEVVDISLGAGDPQAGYNAMSSHTWGPRHCQGGEYDGGKCNFKREMVTESFWDDRQKSLDDKRQLRQEQTGEVPLPQETTQEVPEDTIDQDLEAPAVESPDLGGSDIEAPMDLNPISESTMALAASVQDVVPLKEDRDEVPDRVSASPKVQENNPSNQRDESGKQVPCPQCGGDGKTANNKDCSRCEGRGKVGDWGPSTLDALESKTAADKGNTDLDGPSPKMDKAKWTPENVKKIKDDSTEHPTKEKDITEPIKAVNGDELEEIGEKTTEKVELDTAGDESSGFGTGGEEKGEKTKTFPKGKKEVDPVTKESISSRQGFYPGQQGNSDEELAYLDSEHPINYDDGSMEGDHYMGRHYDQPHPECPQCQGVGDWTQEYGDPQEPAGPMLPSPKPHPYPDDIPF